VFAKSNDVFLIDAVKSFDTGKAKEMLNKGHSVYTV
jgi:hypothetical protein